MIAQLYCIFFAMLHHDFSAIDKQIMSALCLQDYLRYGYIFGDVPLNNAMTIRLHFPPTLPNLDDGGVSTTF